ncbi:GDSL-type esterase/lipase family protein [candidate division KSB1 bacterium]|nr:GDSL-type esterase/lipase family protein [candidate division KSB1 bacterium]
MKNELLLFLLIWFQFTSSHPAEAQLKIMPLGDSITQGEISVVMENQSLLSQIDASKISYRADGAMGILMDSNGGYRLTLEQMLLEMSWDLEMVGQRTEGGGHHEGYPGYMTSDLLAILDDILLANPPHVILLHIGTNDLPAPIDPESCYQNINEMLDMIHAFDPEIKVILAQIIPCLQNTILGAERFPAIIELNNLLPQIPQERDYVTLVDMWTAFVETDDWENALMSGTYHPNEQGYDLMAENWRDKLDIIIKGRSPVVSAILPNEGFNNQANFDCVIEGDYFLDGVSIYLRNNEKLEALFASQVTFVNANQVTSIFDLTQAAIGEWEVVAINPNHMRSIDSPGIIFTIRGAEGRAAIFGAATYANITRPVPQAIINLTHQEGITSDTTLDDGNYRFENILNGTTSLVPFKQGDQFDSITGSDALLILQYLAFLTDLSDDQLIASDVTEDGAITGSDAQAILRYLAFYSENIGATGQWRFDPPDTNFILNNDTNIDFKTLLLGDANLNWGEISSKNNISTKQVEKSLASRSALTFDNWSAQAAPNLSIPLKLKITDEPVQSMVFTILFDSTCLQYLATEKLPLIDEFMVIANGANPGKIHIAMAGIKGIESENEFLQLHFKSKVCFFENSNPKLEITRARINDVEMDCSVHQEVNLSLSDMAAVSDQFNLIKNYPNPFNNQTKIFYNISSPTHVTLSVYNVLGQKVAQLADEFQSAGRHYVIWDAEKNSSGVYFCRMEAGNYSKILKILLVK